MVQLPRSNRSVCLHRRGRPPGRPGGTSKTQHMLWANSQPPRCESVKGFHACTNVALRIPDSRRAARRKRHIRPSVPPTQCSALRLPFRQRGLGLPRAAAPTAETGDGARLRRDARIRPCAGGEILRQLCLLRMTALRAVRVVEDILKSEKRATFQALLIPTP